MAEEHWFNTLRAANVARNAEWAQVKLSLSYRGNELAGECGEACNVIKKLEREAMGMRGSRDSLGHLKEELEDILICVDLIGMALGIEFNVADKFNATSEANGLTTRLVHSRAD